VKNHLKTKPVRDGSFGRPVTLTVGLWVRPKKGKSPNSVQCPGSRSVCRATLTKWEAAGILLFSKSSINFLMLASRTTPDAVDLMQTRPRCDNRAKKDGLVPRRERA
jgi:hypothetical protein